MDMILCSLKNRGDLDECKKMPINRMPIIGLLILIAAAAVINFFVGWAIGSDVMVGVSYLAYSLVLSLILLFIGVPGLGIWAAIIAGDMTSTMEGLLGIASNPWLAAIGSVTVVGGIILQVLIVIGIIMMIIKMISFKSKESKE